MNNDAPLYDRFDGLGRRRRLFRLGVDPDRPTSETKQLQKEAPVPIEEQKEVA